MRFINLKRSLFILLIMAISSLSTCSTVVYASNGSLLNTDKADLSSFLNLVAGMMHMNILVDHRVKGVVTIKTTEDLTDDQLKDVFYSVLEMNNLTAIKVGNITKIIPRKEGISTAPLRAQGKDTLVTRVVILRYIQVSEILPFVTSMLSSDSMTSVYSKGNVLLIVDTNENVERVMKIIHQIDRPSNIGMTYVTLEFIDSIKAKEILEASNGGSNGVTVAAVPGSNSIILTGSDPARREASLLLKMIDLPSSSKMVHVIPIYNNKAATIMNSIKPVIGDDIDIGINKESNSLIINCGTAKCIPLFKIISTLDKPKQQVLLEVIVAEVSKSSSRTLGIDWGFNQTINGHVVASGIGNGALATGGGTNLISSSSIGMVLGFFKGNPIQLGIALSALEEQGDANLLSTPSLLAANNTTADILVGQNLPFITSSTSGSSGVQPFQTIERRDIGLSLKVKPLIDPITNRITLEIEQEISSVVPNVISAADLVTNKRRISTVATVENDKVLVIGGLLDRNKNDLSSGLPFTRNSTFFSRLFGTTTNTNKQTNLIIFIHPKIVNMGMDHIPTNGIYGILPDGLLDTLHSKPGSPPIRD